MRPFLAMLALRSAWNRRFTLALTAASIALSAFMLLGVERIRGDLRDSFASAVSGTDLIVGPRTGSVQLLLYAVFHVGSPRNNIGWDTVQAVAAQPAVAWVVPLSLGDSHRGFPVVGTSVQIFERLRHGEQQPLRFAAGGPFVQLFDAVLGAEVAERLGYGLGQRLTLAHGSGELEQDSHADKPFGVVGVLARTGTPIDRSVLISLQAMQALHADWVGGMRLPGAAPAALPADLTPRSVTAALVGLQRRAQVFSVQRWINDYRGEPVMAILPGVAMDELWDVIGPGEQALLAMSGLVALVSMAGLVAVVLAGLNERRRELAVLRAVGAGPLQIVGLLALEGLWVTLAGLGLGLAALWAVIAAAGPWLQSEFGLGLRLAWPSAAQWGLLAALLAAGVLASLVPGWRAYRLSLADGLTPRT
ncbi:ABC transporter permease [Pseudorhodoferax sp.]|uniref:ABC transporter permease n=1 Tax=Pseudorhodoferax sp. TaxID=1993553 RepID=UPI0039E3BABF